MSEITLDREIAKLLTRYPIVRLAVLFGSLARGRGGAGSDLDLAVAGPRALLPEEKLALIGELAHLTGRPVDLIDLQAAGAPILSQTLTTGKMIFCADRSLYAELIKRMMFDEADLMPCRERILAQRRKAWIDG